MTTNHRAHVDINSKNARTQRTIFAKNSILTHTRPKKNVHAHRKESSGIKSLPSWGFSKKYRTCGIFQLVQLTKFSMTFWIFRLHQPTNHGYPPCYRIFQKGETFSIVTMRFVNCYLTALAVALACVRGVSVENAQLEAQNVPQLENQLGKFKKLQLLNQLGSGLVTHSPLR